MKSANHMNIHLWLFVLAIFASFGCAERCWFDAPSKGISDNRVEMNGQIVFSKSGRLGFIGMKSQILDEEKSRYVVDHIRNLAKTRPSGIERGEPAKVSSAEFIVFRLGGEVICRSYGSSSSIRMTNSWRDYDNDDLTRTVEGWADRKEVKSERELLPPADELPEMP